MAVNPLLRALALMVCVVWTLTINHCALEMVATFEFLACLPDQSASHQPSDCGDADACSTVEDGFYRPEQDSSLDSQVVAGCFQPAVFELVPREGIIASATSALQDVAPPELVRTWSFRTRTAAAARAPSFA